MFFKLSTSGAGRDAAPSSAFLCADLGCHCGKCYSGSRQRCVYVRFWLRLSFSTEITVVGGKAEEGGGEKRQ